MPEPKAPPIPGEGLTPQRAKVIPRGHRQRSTACLPIDQLLLPVIHSATHGLILLSASPGGGKTTAGCLLTGSRIIDGCFAKANLANTGLADIHWENADLRGANFKHASFHMGSSRSGLVGSTIPGEGSKTGFYTDDYNDLTYKPAEEIRKACLCGANLMGAEVEGTDFYLVDLRGAVYSKSQGRHFARTGAILR